MRSGSCSASGSERRTWCSPTSGCKGLQRRAVVLCINQHEAADRSRERLYVGLSRATDQLVVVGDPDVVLQMGGPEVARRLGIG